MTHLPMRFWAKVRIAESGCWEWTACNVRGYGHYGHDGKQWQTHRLAYEWLVGPIPAGLQIDHLCRNKGCCNPLHMEPVTPRENTIRERRLRVVCPHGHAYTPENTVVRNGQRSCRECKLKALREWRIRTGYRSPRKAA